LAVLITSAQSSGSLEEIISKAMEKDREPLHQPSVILKENRKFEKEKQLNGECANNKLSQQRGSPHVTVVKL
jgi:hypothetical protein